MSCNKRHSKLGLFLLLVCLLAVGFPVQCYSLPMLEGSILEQDTTPKEVYKKACPSVMVIIALDENDQPMSLGTGFYAKNDLIATNLHVVRNAKKIRVFTTTDQKERKVKGIHAVNADHDLAILRMEDSGEALTLASTPLETGDSIYAIGNPRGLEATLSTGIVSAVRTLDKTAMYQITAPISPGSSGGPVLNAKAQVVGIATSYVQDGQNLNFAVNVKHLSETISSNSKNDVQTLDVLSKADPAPAEKRTIALQTVRIVSPEFFGTSDFTTTPFSNKLIWNLSVKNDGDKAVKNIDVLILIMDKDNNEIVHFVRKKIDLNVPPKLAKRTKLEEGGLDFNTTPAGIKWTCEYRVLNFEYDE